MRRRRRAAAGGLGHLRRRAARDRRVARRQGGREPFDVADRCAATFVWWQNPYQRLDCSEYPDLVLQPAGYLLPYWMARYYGFLGAAD